MSSSISNDCFRDAFRRDLEPPAQMLAGMSMGDDASFRHRSPERGHGAGKPPQPVGSCSSRRQCSEQTRLANERIRSQRRQARAGARALATGAPDSLNAAKDMAVGNAGFLTHAASDVRHMGERIDDNLKRYVVGETGEIFADHQVLLERAKKRLAIGIEKRDESFTTSAEGDCAKLLNQMPGEGAIPHGGVRAFRADVTSLLVEAEKATAELRVSRLAVHKADVTARLEDPNRKERSRIDEEHRVWASKPLTKMPDEFETGHRANIGQPISSQRNAHRTRRGIDDLYAASANSIVAQNYAAMSNMSMNNIRNNYSAMNSNFY